MSKRQPPKRRAPVPHLPADTNAVVEASTRLPWTYKAIWLKVHAFEGIGYRKGNGCGCYLNAGQLAEMLGIAERTVENYRTDLVRLELLHVERGQGIAFWYPILPTDCLPESREPDEIARRRHLLDEHIARLSLPPLEGEVTDNPFPPPNRPHSPLRRGLHRKGGRKVDIPPPPSPEGGTFKPTPEKRKPTGIGNALPGYLHQLAEQVEQAQETGTDGP